MTSFNIVAATTENTVVTSYEPVKKRSDSYQSEAALEREFIQLLTRQGYEYLQIHQEADLIGTSAISWSPLQKTQKNLPAPPLQTGFFLL